jgi:hypothetical protein
VVLRQAQRTSFSMQHPHPWLARRKLGGGGYRRSGTNGTGTDDEDEAGAAGTAGADAGLFKLRCFFLNGEAGASVAATTAASGPRHYHYQVRQGKEAREGADRGLACAALTHVTCALRLFQRPLGPGWAPADGAPFVPLPCARPPAIARYACHRPGQGLGSGVGRCSRREGRWPQHPQQRKSSTWRISFSLRVEPWETGPLKQKADVGSRYRLRGKYVNQQFYDRQ